MQLTVAIEIKLQVGDRDSFQEKIAAELRKHATYLEYNPASSSGSRGAVSWNVVITPDAE